MSKGISKFIQLGIVGIWLSLTLILAYRHFISGVQVSSLQSLSKDRFQTSEEWLGIYVQDEKIGYVKISSEKIGDEYRFSQYNETDIPQGDITTHRTTKFTCLTGLDYSIKSFEFDSRSGNTFFHSRGELDEDNVLLVFIETDKQKKTETVDIHGRPYLFATVKQMLLERGFQKGKRFTVPVLDIFSLKVNDTVVEVQDLIPVKVGINVNTAYKLKIGGNYTWLSDGGTTLREENATGLLYLSETEDMAKSNAKRPIFDFLSLPSIKSGTLLSSPEDLTLLKVRMSGIDVSKYPLINEGRQAVEGDVLEISKENLEQMEEATYDLPYTGDDFKSYLAPTPFIQSDHHTIQYNARKFVDIEKHAFRLARFLASNLYMTITKMPSSHISTAIDVFNSHKGESNEHTVMFTSFARAAGMPVRMVGGLVYLNGYFYYHTWPEVWFGRWVPVDPSMGQFPADVTHIRIMEGDIEKLASLGEIIRGVKIDIMEAL